MRALGQDVSSVLAGAVALRRTIHQRPEVAFAEVETARLVAERMRARGLAVSTGLGKTGVKAVLDTGRPGPVVLLRADLDALPLREETGLSFAATNGAMHACGHDGHVAALDAAADLLLLDPPRRGTVVLAFQPAEEGAGGAAAMIADGVLEDPRPDAVFGIHLWTALPLGTVGAAAGPQMAAVDEFRIQVEGPGGHAASPHETRDTVVAAAAVVTALQSITSRRLSPLQAAVVTVSSIHGGAAFNVIPDRVILTGTCRGFDREVIERLPGLVESVASAAAATAGCRATTTYRRTNGAVVNDAAEAARCLRLATEAAGATGVAHDVRTMGGEDFCEFLAHAPGAFAFVGAAKAGHGLGPAHHAPDFDFDERALPIAARLYAAYARDLLDVPRPAV